MQWQVVQSTLVAPVGESRSRSLRQFVFLRRPWCQQLGDTTRPVVHGVNNSETRPAPLPM
eukprot:2317857-Lingulodinium_polyedra.AAC.1